MNVKLYTRTDYIDRRSLMSSPEHSDVSVAAEKRQENFDKVTIGSGFSQALTQSAGSAVSQRIVSLRQQIASGTYQMDSRRIAECMLARRSQPGIF